jgi:hypothetical protein
MSRPFITPYFITSKVFDECFKLWNYLFDEPTNEQMISNLLYYACYNTPTCFYATAPSSEGLCPVPAKLHKQLNAELVIFLKLYVCFVVKFKIVTMLKLLNIKMFKL